MDVDGFFCSFCGGLGVLELLPRALGFCFKAAINLVNCVVSPVTFLSMSAMRASTVLGGCDALELWEGLLEV